MQNFEEYIALVEIRNDLISYSIFFGGLLAIIIGIAMCRRNNPLSDISKFIGILFIFIGIINLDLWLCYTSLILKCIWVNDFSDVLALCIPPLFYFVLKSSLKDRRFNFKKDWKHFIIPFIFLCNYILFFLQPNEYKILAYIDYNFPELKVPKALPTFNFDPLNIKELITVWIAGSLLFYSYLSFRYLKKHNLIQPIFKNRKIKNKLDLIRRNFLWVIFALFVFLVAKNMSDSDSLNYMIGLFISVFVISTVIFIVNNSKIFERNWIADKYETSGLKTNGKSNDIEKIRKYLSTSKFYKREDATLTNLSGEMNMPSNYLSQTINSSLGINFNELINEYRIEESKKMLLDPSFAHLSIEGISSELGYKSKSTFYVAFKKHTGHTPKKFVSSQINR